MGPGGVGVHVSDASYSVFLGHVDQPLQLVLGGDVHLSFVLDVRPFQLALSYFEISLGGVNQVVELFHVQLQNGDFEFEFDALG